MHWNLKERKYMASEKKDGKALEDNEHIVCFFSCITALVENKKAKAGQRRNDSGAVRKT